MRFILSAVLLLWASVSSAQTTAITDVAARAHVVVNGGAMFLTTREDWSGASLGGQLVYNLHPQFSVFGRYDHGFPINDVDEPLDMWRVAGNLRVHPNVGVGFGYGHFTDEIEGGLAQIVIGKIVMPRVSLNGSYTHVFPKGDLDDFEFAQVYVNYHLLGR